MSAPSVARLPLTSFSVKTESALAGDGASAASSFINEVRGKKAGKGKAKNEAIKTLAQKLLEAEGELVSLDEGDEVLSDEQLEARESHFHRPTPEETVTDASLS